MVKIVVSGAMGRMGKRITELAGNDKDIELVAGVELESYSDPGVVSALSDIKKKYDCIIEFTTAQATVEHVRAAKSLKKAMVIGTTGLSDKDMEILKDASRAIPIVFSPNMSVGVNVFFELIRKAAGVLGMDYTVKIKEAHHIHKKDSPSGTAKFIAGIVKEEMKRGDVPIQAIREGEIVGDHDIFFESDVDVIRISHSAKTRDIFALGALRAAKFVVRKKNGLFSMSDVLNLKKV